MNSAIFCNWKAPQRLDNRLCSKEGVGQHGMVVDAVAEGDAMQAVDCDNVLARQNYIVQVVDGLSDNGRYGRGETPITAIRRYGMPWRDAHAVNLAQPRLCRHVHDHNCKNDGAISKHVARPQLANASGAGVT